MELIECGDCGVILTQDELTDPVYNEVWQEVCEVCFTGYNFKPTYYLTFIALEDIVDNGLALVEKASGLVREIRIEIHQDASIANG